jgi:hypothetical protein
MAKYIGCFTHIVFVFLSDSPGSDRAGFVEFFRHTREQAGDWRGAGVSQVQRAVDGDCSKGLLSFDATERTWSPESLELEGSEGTVEGDTAEIGEHDLCAERASLELKRPLDGEVGGDGCGLEIDHP